MIKSMTGFSKISEILENTTYNFEIRCLNNKQLDISVKFPTSYKEYEFNARKLIGEYLERGKIELYLNITNEVKPNNYSINSDIASNYYDMIIALSKELNLEKSDVLNTLLKLPDVITKKDNENEIVSWEIFESILLKLLAECDNYRIAEGNSLYKDLISNINNIKNNLTLIPPLEAERINFLRNKFSESFIIFKNSNEQLNLDENRFEQEIFWYLEKLDISEEKTRLTHHLNYFSQIIEEDNSNGKKLNFIAQEIGREINTIGSKASHADIQKIVVNMKDDLEKIKEQLSNVL